MATYEFNDQIKFLLPSGFMLTREENDDGEEVVKIISGEYENDDGETCYKFSCNVTVNEFDPDDVDDDITSANLLDKLAERMEDSRRLKLPGTPEAVFINKGTPISIFGRLLKMFACICLVRASDWSTLQLVSVTRMSDDEPEENSVVYENMYEVLKAVRINGKKVPVESVSPYMLQDALELSFDENGESIDVSPTIKFNITAGDETRTYEFTSEGMKQVDYDEDSFELFSDKHAKIDCDVSYAQINDFHNELREELLEKMNLSGNYSYPETEDGIISGVFTEEPDFDALERICAYAVRSSDSDYDGDWSAEQLYSFLKNHISRYHQGDRYNIYLSFGGLLPVLALLPFLAVSSKISSLDVTFTHDKWEARGDYTSENRVGVKLSGGQFLVGKFDNDTVFEDEESDEGYDQHAADEWMEKYGSYVEKKPNIDFNGTLFVFSGLAGHWAEKDHPTVQKVIEKGGQYRSKVSGLTNYLVVNPADAGSSKIVAVMEQLQKGKNVKVILLSDLEAALGETKATKTTTTKSATKTATAIAVPENIIEETSSSARASNATSKTAFCGVDRIALSDGTDDADAIITIPEGITVIEDCKFISSEIAAIELPGTLKEIGRMAFAKCINIKTLVIPDGVTTISDGAFSNCTGLTSVIIPGSVTSIGNGVFEGCVSLTDVFFGNGYSTIGKSMFSECTGLTNIFIPDSVTYIDEWAFKKCTGINEVLIPNSVRVIGNWAFSDCSQLKRISISDKTSFDSNAFLNCHEQFEVMLSEGSTSVPPALKEIFSLTKVIIPNSFTAIEKESFSVCTKLEEVILPDTVEEIGEEAFCACFRIKKTFLPSKLKTIGNSAFRRCEGLTDIIIPDGTTTIEESAFEGCTNLGSAIIPRSVKSISDFAFSECSNLSSIVISDCTQCESAAFYNCNNLKTIVIAEGAQTIPDWIESIRSLSNIILPNGVSVIPESAFYGCSNLSEIIIPDSVISIEPSAFDGCGSLTDVIIPNGVTTIDCFAFAECVSLKEIIIPESVNEIGLDALPSNCVVCTTEGSFAEQYCKENNIPCIIKTLDEMANYEQLRKSKQAGYYEDIKLKIAQIDAELLCRRIEQSQQLAVATEANRIRQEEITRHSNEIKAKSRQKANAVKYTPEEKMRGLGDDLLNEATHASDLSAQIAELDAQELSAEDRETLNRVKEQMNEIGEQLEQGQSQMSKYGDYLEQKEQREKAAEEEKARLKAEALAAGKSEKDIVNMYIILTNEKKLGMLHRSADDFYETYEDDFPALSKEEVISTRKDMLAEMDDETLCAYYAASFKQRSVEDRFSVSTRNLNNVNPEPEMTVKATWAIENSKEWYQESELAEVRRLMDADLAHTRADLDSQFDTIDSAWKKFATGKEFLQIAISDKAADGSDLDDNFSNFQIVVGSQLVAVQIASKGIFRMSTTIMNCFTWYWGVTVREIWEAAMKNDIYDSREGASNGSQLANQAMNQIRAKYPTAAPTSAPKSAATSYSKPTTPPAPAKPVQTATPTPTQPAKKEGCYIATAVYGSYDAPQVLTLRRFRDDVLAHSVLGRWFIRTYYRLSPPIAERLKDAKMINGWVRSILDRIVSKLNNKQHH